ncbi:hypothetical protein I4F81_001382 [Pyropia yezoensis]|uniref:Uncharacterized protein n=1 Tax=Pyropia yezoensis TaxID=2788 RepID=A0ACC3BLK4_PYRYE|nr:hypothetical protein I4F81_001382 [Neopyropia yezoensis]
MVAFLASPSPVGPPAAASSRSRLRSRLVCGAPDCGRVAYVNPKPVVGVVATSADGRRVLLVRRAGGPRAGTWGFPQGFLEAGEPAAAGAAREAAEEAGAAVRVGSLVGVYDVLGARQLLVVYRGVVAEEGAVGVGRGAAGEVDAAAMVDWDAIDWGGLSFVTVGWALRRVLADIQGSPEGGGQRGGVQCGVKSLDGEWVDALPFELDAAAVRAAAGGY